MDKDKSATFEGYCILELMGHRRLGGYVTETTLAGAGVLRIDVPGDGDEPIATQYYTPSALYCLTPCSEAAARAVAKANRPEPVERWELPQIEAPRNRPSRRYDDPNPDADDDDDSDELDPKALPF